MDFHHKCKLFQWAGFRCFFIQLQLKAAESFTDTAAFVHFPLFSMNQHKYKKAVSRAESLLSSNTQRKRTWTAVTSLLLFGNKEEGRVTHRWSQSCFQTFLDFSECFKSHIWKFGQKGCVIFFTCVTSDLNMIPYLNNTALKRVLLCCWVSDAAAATRTQNTGQEHLFHQPVPLLTDSSGVMCSSFYPNMFISFISL